MARQLPRPTNVPTIIQGFACGANRSIAAVTEYRWTSLHENGHVEQLINGFQLHQNAICIERSEVALGHDAFETCSLTWIGQLSRWSCTEIRQKPDLIHEMR